MYGRDTLELVRMKGEKVTCENGHELYELTEDAFARGKQKASMFKSIHPDVLTPVPNEPIDPKCPVCDAVYTKMAGAGRRKFHFADGWS